MNVLVACEFSEIVKEQFLFRGHDAHSCDILPGEKGLRNHWQTDVLQLLRHNSGRFELMIAFPPCTYLASSGARWFKSRQKEQAAAIEFFLMLAYSTIPRIAIENPIGIMSTKFRKPDQIIQPNQFGEDASKATCLWLKGLPELKPTKHIEPHLSVTGKLIWGNQTKSGQNKLAPSEHRKADRSRTYQGIAEAMAEQWGNLCP